MSYYFTPSNCPWCDAPRPPFGIANIFLRDPSLEDDGRTPLRVVCRAPGRPALVQRVILQTGRETALTNRHLTGNHDETPQLLARLEGTRMLIQGTDSCAHALEHRRDGKQDVRSRVLRDVEDVEFVSRPVGEAPAIGRDSHRRGEGFAHREGGSRITLTAYDGPGLWRAAGSPALTRTLTNAKLTQLGFHSLHDRYRALACVPTARR